MHNTVKQNKWKIAKQKYILTRALSHEISVRNALDILIPQSRIKKPNKEYTQFDISLNKVYLIYHFPFV